MGWTIDVFVATSDEVAKIDVTADVESWYPLPGLRPLTISRMGQDSLEGLCKALGLPHDFEVANATEVTMDGPVGDGYVGITVVPPALVSHLAALTTPQACLDTAIRWLDENEVRIDVWEDEDRLASLLTDLANLARQALSTGAGMYVLTIC